MSPQLPLDPVGISEHDTIGSERVIGELECSMPAAVSASAAEAGGISELTPDSDGTGTHTERERVALPRS